MIRDIKFAKARQKSQEFYDNSVISGCHPLQPALCRLKRKAEKLIESGPSDHDSDEIEENLLLSPKANKRDNKANMGLFWNGFIGWEEKALVTLPTDDPGAGSGFFLLLFIFLFFSFSFPFSFSYSPLFLQEEVLLVSWSFPLKPLSS